MKHHNKHAGKDETEVPVPDFRQHVVTEKQELDVKIEKLAEFLDGPNYVKVLNLEQDLLQRQVLAMRQYSTILGERIKIAQ